MNERLQGRKGRPAKGPRRSFKCSDEEFAPVRLAAMILGVEMAEVMRAGAIAHAESLLKENASKLSQVKTDDPLLQLAARKILDK